MCLNNNSYGQRDEINVSMSLVRITICLVMRLITLALKYIKITLEGDALELYLQFSSSHLLGDMLSQ